ncbi:MAG: hypothetical protein D6800_09165 [Candidatus Zixiibacteriota bacterium]|nr:MAG: hypothetical protein D6800_09165 [candidate division Zixibacteria bacterium]
MTDAISLSGLTNCTQPVLQSGGTATRREFNCTAIAPGTVTATLTNGSTAATAVVEVLDVVFSAVVSDAAAPFLPTPEMGQDVTIVVTGQNLIRPVEIVWTGCASALTPLVQSATLQTYRCTAANRATDFWIPGILANETELTVKLAEETRTFFPGLVQHRIDGVSPGVVTIGRVTMQVAGANLYPELEISLPGCGNLQIDPFSANAQGYSNNWAFSCDLTAPGTYAGVLTNGPDTVAFAVTAVAVPTIESVAFVPQNCVSYQNQGWVWNRVRVSGVYLDTASSVTVETGEAGCRFAQPLTETATSTAMEFGRGVTDCHTWQNHTTPVTVYVDGTPQTFPNIFLPLWCS